MEYPLRSDNGAPVFTDDLFPSNRAVYSLDPFALWTALPNGKRAGETALSKNENRAPRQPIAASFGADDGSRGFNHWYRFPYAFLPC
jgi:hypothetical protein